MTGHFIKEPVSSGVLQKIVRNATGSKDSPVIREIHTGMFNNVYSFTASGQKGILKIAPNENRFILPNEKLLLQREASLANLLADCSAVFPRLVYTDFSRSLIARDYLILEMKNGVIWDTIMDTLSPAENQTLYRSLGQINREINKTVSKSYGFPEPAARFNTWSEAVMSNTGAMAEMAAELGITIRNLEKFAGHLEKKAGYLDEIKRASLVHGDLWPKNILVERSSSGSSISGIIDCERGYWGDPMAEWIIHFLDLPADYWEGYGENPRDRSSLIRNSLYKGMYCIQLYLEMKREKKDDSWIDPIFDKVIKSLDTC